MFHVNNWKPEILKRSVDKTNKAISSNHFFLNFKVQLYAPSNGVFVISCGDGKEWFPTFKSHTHNPLLRSHSNSHNKTRTHALRCLLISPFAEVCSGGCMTGRGMQLRACPVFCCLVCQWCVLIWLFFIYFMPMASLRRSLVRFASRVFLAGIIKAFAFCLFPTCVHARQWTW